MIPDWQANTLYVSSLLPKRFPEVYSDIRAAIGQVKLLHETADIWVRDFMPVQIDRNRFVQFRYWPDYLKGFPKLRTGPEALRQMLPAGAQCKECSLVVDGGNVVFSTTTAILTNKVFRENPKLTKRQVLERLENVLECRIVIIPPEPGDITGHADGMLHFIDDAMVLLNDYSRVCPSFGHRLEQVLRKNKIGFQRIPYVPSTNYTTHGFGSAVGNHANFARVRNTILAPSYATRRDALVSRTLCRSTSQIDAKRVRVRRLASEGGVLHCVSWTILR